MKSAILWLRERFSKQAVHRSKPRILLLVDYKGWAFDNSAREIAHQLRKDFDFTICHVHSQPKLEPSKFDLIYVFFWGETYHQQFGFAAERTLKEVSSHRWQDDLRFGPCTPAGMTAKFLRDAETVLCTSKRLQRLVQPYHSRVFLTPNGIDPKLFRRIREREGPLTIGWAGNVTDPVKGIRDCIEPACDGRFRLLLAPGGVSHRRMNNFYNRCDVLAVASTHEGEPLTLLEGMAAGCFPVCTDVGIVPEIIQDRQNGIIVPERTPTAFRAAFEWCEKHLDQVRRAGAENERLIHEERNWEKCSQQFRQVFTQAIDHARRPRFRNDDVSADTSLERLREFCGVFQRYGLDQVHGITLRGRTNSYYRHEGESVEYQGLPNLGELSNERIRELSEGLCFEDRTDLIEYLGCSTDQIALHGYYHTDYSKMTDAQQRDEMTRGLHVLQRLFPSKTIRYFIAPFNRTNQHTSEVAKGLGLKVLSADGVHMEERLHDFRAEPETWYRYHHHRFYPESTFPYWRLSLQALDQALARNFQTKARAEQLHKCAVETS